MNRPVMLTGFLLFCLLFTAVIAPAQGLYWESGRQADDAKAEKEYFYYMPRKMKAVLDEHDNIAIMRFDKELLYVLDTKKKTYYEITFDQIESMAKQAGGALKQVEEQMANMPEEQRKMMEQMMGSKFGMREPAYAVKKTGERKSISGFGCTKWILLEDGKESGTIWATMDVKEIESMRRDLEEFSRRMAALSPKSSKGLIKAMSDVEGFPIQTRIKDEKMHTVTKIEKRNTPAGEFEVPSGFKKTAMPGMSGDYKD